MGLGLSEPTLLVRKQMFESLPIPGSIRLDLADANLFDADPGATAFTDFTKQSWGVLLALR